MKLPTQPERYDRYMEQQRSGIIEREFVRLGTAIGSRPLRLSDFGQMLLTGSATPEGAIDAPVGSIFLRSDGGAGTTLYVKESGTGNTGWAAK